MRAVLDTNVIVSATLIRGGNEDRILRAWEHGAFDLVLSPEILDEIGRVLAYDRLRRLRWVTDEKIVTLLEALALGSLLVPGRVRVEASRDPEDNKFLAAALEGRAGYVVTGDRDLLDLDLYRGVRMIRPGAFLRLLAKGKHR